MLNDDEVWEKILVFARSRLGKSVPLLNPKKRSPFIVTEVADDYIRINKLPIEMRRQMFLSIYAYLMSRRGWVEIGARRVEARPETIEGLIKTKFFNGNMNGLSTATWLSAILVYSNIEVEFNNKAMGQKLRLSLRGKQRRWNNYLTR